MRNDLRTPEIISQMKNFREQGKTLKEISKEYNCSPGLVKTLINESVISHEEKTKSIIGQKFNSITVLKRVSQNEAPWKSHAIPLLVHCEICDTTWIMRKEYLGKDCPYCKNIGRGHTIDLTNQRFGYLTVLEKDFNKTSTKLGAYWKCKCDCGNIISVRMTHLLGQGHNRTISCGCAKRSFGELQTQKAIEDLGLIYNIEVIIPECHKWSPFDIEVINPHTNKRLCFFECDGEHHFSINRFSQTQEELQHQQKVDNIKNIWCKENNIPLFRIPYTEYENINANYLLSRFPDFKMLLESL